ncbi:MAG: hypothetical protein SGILL_010386 [Bacillariaceae sp.]
MVDGEGGYAISGTTNDPDGVTNIDDGFCAYNGRAFWKEMYVSGGDNVGMQVLNKGEFDFIQHRFEGQWWASSDESGTFESFELDEKDESSTVAESIDIVNK